MLKEKILAAGKRIILKNFREQRITKYSKFFAGLLILVIVGLIVPFDFARADIGTAIGGLLMSILYGVIYVIFYILFVIAHLIAWIGASVVSISLNPAIMNQVFSNPAIYTSWKLIRDICNLLFLLIMLFIAFGTIIQHSKYNIKNNLLKLVIAIFLINFSNVVAGVIIDFGNIIMFGVLKWMCPVASNTCFQDSYASLMAVVDDFSVTYSLTNVGLDLITAEAAVGMAIATIYTFIYGFILLALAAFLMVRTAGLAILLILSPFAYFGPVMPGMEKIGQKWWSKIWSYSLFGPIFVLMLYISSEIAKTTISVPPISNPDLAVWGTLIATIITNIIPLLFLLSIISITRELSLLGTSVILNNTTGMGEKIGVGAAKYVGSAADRFAARGARPGMPLYRRALSNLSPGAWRRAARSMKSEQEHDYDIAAGSHWNKLEKLPGGNRNVNREQVAVDREIARVMSTLSDNIGQLVDTNKKAVAGNNPVVIEASMRKIAQSGDTNKVLRELGFSETREGFSDYLQKVKDVVGKERTQVLAYEVAQSEDKDGNSSYIGFSHEFDDDSQRLLNLRDPYYRSKKDGMEFKINGVKATPEETERHIADLKQKDAVGEGGITNRYSEWVKEYKTDKQYQQHSVNAKLANKSAYSRHSKFKVLTIREQEEELRRNEKGELVYAPKKDEKGDSIFHIGEQGEEYYNTIGDGNLKDMRFIIKREGEKMRDDLYDLARNRKVTKWSKDAVDANGNKTGGTYGLTEAEQKHLHRLEEIVGPAEGRDKGPMKAKVRKLKSDGTPEKDANGNDIWEEKEIIKPYEKTDDENDENDENSEVVLDSNDQPLPFGENNKKKKRNKDKDKGGNQGGSTGGNQGGYDDTKSAEIFGRIMTDRSASQQEVNAGIGKTKPTAEEQKVLDSIRKRAAGSKTRTILPGTEAEHWSEKEAAKVAETAKSSQVTETRIEEKKDEVEKNKERLAQEVRKVKKEALGLSAEEYQAKLDELMKAKKALQEQKKEINVAPEIARQRKQEEDIVDARISNTINKQMYKAQVGEMVARTAKGLGKHESDSSVLDKVLKSEEYQSLDLKDKINDINLKMADAKYASDRNRADRLFEEKKNLVREYIKKTNVDTIKQIEKLEANLERRRKSEKPGERSIKLENTLRNKIDNLKKELEAKTNRVLNEK